MPTRCSPCKKRTPGWTGLSPFREPEFLNVDLEIDSPAKLDELVVELGERVIVLYSGPLPKRGRRLLTLEIFGQCQGPDDTIHALCALVEKLSPTSRRLWGRARKRFDVGYALSGPEGTLQFALRPDTLERLAKLGASLAVSCYRPEHFGVSK